jgi:hypothetical protein
MKQSELRCPICDGPIKLKKLCDKCVNSNPSVRVIPLPSGTFSVGYEIKYSDTPIGRVLKKHGPKYDYGLLLTEPIKYEEDK